MPSHTTSDYLHLERMARRELRYREIKYRHRAICEIIVDYSFGCGRDDAFIQTQNVFAQLTNISKGNVSTILCDLQEKKVVFCAPSAGLYEINLNFDQWGFESCFRDEFHHRAAHRYEDLLLQAAAVRKEQLHLIEPLPDLDALLADGARFEILRKIARPGENQTNRADIGGNAALPSDDVLSASSHGTSVFGRGGDSNTGSDGSTVSRHRGDSGTQPPAEGSLPSGAALEAKIAHSILTAGSSQIGNSGPHISSQIGNSGSQIGNSEGEKSSRIGNSLAPARSSLIHNEETTSLINDINERSGAGSHGFYEIPNAPRKPALESELLLVIEEVIGGTANYGGRWRKAIRYNAVAVRETIGEIRLRKARGERPKKGNSWGNLANALFGDFSGLKPRKGRAP